MVSYFFTLLQDKTHYIALLPIEITKHSNSRSHKESQVKPPLAAGPHVAVEVLTGREAQREHGVLDLGALNLVQLLRRKIITITFHQLVGTQCDLVYVLGQN